MASAGLTQQEFADLAGTSQQAVSKALGRGHLARRADGRLDPAHPTNAGWIERHQAGSDDRGRWLGSHLGPGQHNSRSPQADLDDDWVRRTLAEQSSDDRVVRLLEELKREIAALRRDLLTDRPYIPGVAELKREVGSLEFKLGVVFHQLCLAIAGKPITIAAAAFPPETRQAGNL